MNKKRIEIRQNIEENKKEIVRMMENDLNYFMSMKNSKKEFPITFPMHDVEEMLDCLEERMDLNGETEWEGSTAYYALSDYIYDKVIKVYGPINVVERPRGESIYLDENGHNQLELKIDKSIQSILDTEVYAPGYRNTVHYYVVPPRMVNDVWERLNEKYTSGDYKTNHLERKAITQEQVHQEVVRFFEEILNQKSKDTLEEIQKRKNQLIEKLYELQLKEKEFIN